MTLYFPMYFPHHRLLSHYRENIACDPVISHLPLSLGIYPLPEVGCHSGMSDAAIGRCRAMPNTMVIPKFGAHGIPHLLAHIKGHRLRASRRRNLIEQGGGLASLTPPFWIFHN